MTEDDFIRSLDGQPLIRRRASARKPAEWLAVARELTMNEETIRRIGAGLALGWLLAAAITGAPYAQADPAPPAPACVYARRCAMRARPAGLRPTRQQPAVLKQPAGHQRGDQERAAGDPGRRLGRLGRGPMISASNKVRLGVALGWPDAAIVGAGVANADPEGGGVSDF